MKELTLERNSINVKYVVKLTETTGLLKYMREFILERSHMNVRNAVKPTYLSGP